MYPIRILCLALQLAIPVATGHWLAAWCTPWWAFAGSAAVAVLLSAIGVLLVRRAPLEQVTWRNRVAAWLLPWGYRFAKGQLAGIGVWSAVGFAAIAGAVILATTTVTPAAPAGAAEPAGVSWLLVLAWLVDAGALMQVMSMRAGVPPGASPARVLGRVSAVIIALLVGSSVLLLRGHPTAALWVAGGPPLAIGALYGVFVLLVVTVGRNARWN